MSHKTAVFISMSSPRAIRRTTARGTEPPGQTLNLRRDLASGGRRRGSVGYDHHVEVGRKKVGRMPAPFTDQSLDLIPDHGVSDLAGDSDTKPRLARHGRNCRIIPRASEEQEVLSTQAPSAALNGEELTSLAQTPPAREVESLRQGSSIRRARERNYNRAGSKTVASTRAAVRPRDRTRYFLEMLTVSCLRPLRLRRRSISRPAAVFIRLRNPWVRRRLLRWG
jgi:hypothetical protein